MSAFSPQCEGSRRGSANETVICGHVDVQRMYSLELNLIEINVNKMRWVKNNMTIVIDQGRQDSKCVIYLLT